MAAISALALLIVAAPVVNAQNLPEHLVPVGQTVGIDLKCDGVMVVALMEQGGTQGQNLPAATAGLLPGDVIRQVGETKVTTAVDFKTEIAKFGTDTIPLHILRGDQMLQLEMTPVLNNEGEPELGIWLRDGMAGIGTVTFYDPATGIFGALGHAISDVQTGVIMPLGEGRIVPATVSSVTKGEAGDPGELRGEFDFSTNQGVLFANTPVGIFGTVDTPIWTREAVPIGNVKEINLGAATILANVDGTEIREFEIEISRLFTNGDERDMMITITDQALLDKTGGIIQGMSGSPILQDGKIIGAVTHVLVNNPEKGYGVSIENMLTRAYTGVQTQALAA